VSKMPSGLFAEEHGVRGSDGPTAYRIGSPATGTLLLTYGYSAWAQTVAAFVVSAPNDIRALLAHAEAQAAEIARLRADNEGLQQSLEIAIRVAHARAALAGEGD
jgi:hypothetical protein